MAVDHDLLRRAIENPQNLRMEEAVQLAGQFGWIEVGGEGSHRVFHHPRAGSIRQLFPRPLNLQVGRNGKTKAYQVRQLLAMARALGLLESESEEKE
jgi:hypothetical protein